MNIIKKLTNTKTLIGITSLVVFILVTWGVEVEATKIELTVQAVCAIGVMLGILNDEGMTEVAWNK